MTIRSTAVLGFLLAISCSVLAQTPQTMRLDFFHSGDSSYEMFSLDEVVYEALPWTGNMRQPIDKTLRGKYQFEITDDESGEISWSRSFSSIYGEWETTAEARSMNRTFHESLRFPAPTAKFTVTLKKRGAANQFEEIWGISIDPDDYMHHREGALYADQVVAIVNNGDPA